MKHLVMFFSAVLCCFLISSCSMMGDEPILEAGASAPSAQVCNAPAAPGARMLPSISSVAPQRPLAAERCQSAQAAPGDVAFVRLAMYETVPGYQVRITRMEVINAAGSSELPAFGSHLTCAALPIYAFEPAYDRADSSYTALPADVDYQLCVVFDAVLTADDAPAETIRLTDVRASLDAEPRVYAAGTRREHVLRITASLLGLHAIEFDASVEEPEVVGVGI